LAVSSTSSPSSSISWATGSIRNGPNTRPFPLDVLLLLEPDRRSTDSTRADSSPGENGLTM